MGFRGSLGRRGLRLVLTTGLFVGFLFLGISFVSFVGNPLSLSLAIQVEDRSLRVLCQAVLWIPLQKLLERGTRLLGIVQILLVNFADGKQCVKAVLAARIFAAQEFVLRNRLVQDFLVFEMAAHLDQGLRHRNHTGIGLGR